MTPRTHRVGLLLALWCGTGWLLLRLGDGALGVPLSSADALHAWLERTDPAVMAAAALRLVALALCGYLVAASALALLASVIRWRPAVAATRHLMPSMLRRMVLGTASVGLMSTIVSPAVATSAPADSDADKTAVMVKLEPESPSSTATTAVMPTSSTTTTTSPPTSPPSTSPPPPPSATTTSAATTPEPSDPARDASGTASGQPPAGTGTTDTADTTGPTDTNSGDRWIVQPGDSFWSIAEEIVTEQLGPRERETSSPTDADIAGYWRTLIEANRDRLADRTNPDLLFPGQRLRLPDLPGNVATAPRSR